MLKDIESDYSCVSAYKIHFWIQPCKYCVSVLTLRLHTYIYVQYFMTDAVVYIMIVPI